MICPICKIEDSHPDCKHLLAVVDEEEGCCDGPARFLFHDLVDGRGCEEEYEDATGEEGEDWLSRSRAISEFDHACCSVSDRSATWDSTDEQVFGGRSTSYFAEDITRALAALEKHLGLLPKEEDVQYSTPQEEVQASPNPAWALNNPKPRKELEPGQLPIPPMMPTFMGGLPLSPGRVPPHIEAHYGRMRRAARAGRKTKTQEPKDLKD